MISKILQSFSQSLEHFFLTVGQNNFGNKIPILIENHQSISQFTKTGSLKGTLLQSNHIVGSNVRQTLTFFTSVFAFEMPGETFNVSK